MAEKGEELWRDEVWAWGEGKRGQLGQGDMLARPNPVPVLGLHNQFIVKVLLSIINISLLVPTRVLLGEHSTPSTLFFDVN